MWAPLTTSTHSFGRVKRPMLPPNAVRYTAIRYDDRVDSI